MSTAFDITSLVLEGINYINFPPAVADSSIPALEKKIHEWVGADVKLHVLDMQKVVQVTRGFTEAITKFSRDAKIRNASLISINVPEPVAREIKRLGAETAFNRIQNYPADLYQKKTISEMDLKRLLFKYLAMGTYAAVEVSLQSTVSIDENYSMKPAEVPWNEIDLISVVSITGSFLHCEFRLCSSTAVLKKLARSMLGADSPLDNEVVESMATELLNMIYGYAKSNLNDKESFQLPPAIPRLIRKADFGRVKRSSPPDLTIMPMVTPMGAFYVEVDFGKEQSR